MQLYDTHAHVYAEEYADQADTVARESLEKQVWFNNIGTNLETSVAALEMAKKCAKNSEFWVYAVVGCHPHLVDENFDIDKYRQLATDLQVVGIGECGLDYYRLPEGKTLDEVRAMQIPAFEAQIKLAMELDKVLVVHSRPSAGTEDVYEDIMNILENLRPAKMVIHSYTGSWHIAEKYLALGAHIALNGIITFDKSGVLAEVARNCPADKLLLETDAPYLAPVPYRGKQNRPEYVLQVAEKIAELRGVSLQEIAEQTTANARKLFCV